MYSTEEFAARFREQDTQTLVDRLARQELTDEARAAMVQILGERGTADDQLAAELKQSRRNQHLETGADNRCDFCGKGLLPLPFSLEGQKFCNIECFHTSRLHLVAEDISAEDVVEQAHRLKAGTCPTCGGQGLHPDMYASHWIASMLVVTSTRTETKFSCDSCANRTNLWAMLSCATLGWWSFYGVFSTPFRIGSNAFEMLRRKSTPEPSAAMVDWARLVLADDQLRQTRGGRYGLRA